ncbi:hypothetical protein SS50377_22484 [Spironucleus salmonicida]|uniref:Uncharacterized protein n=1 Tax=Spironucleus salmonicida TaxID=348837 RepID=V6LBZ6_9EUKA|nr:hypothetical protein SS50377_22484 [Spironucleus salmonicida]|eukprot:EST42025.1 Hypothetical protein SS50377_18332 [Spironucleus salmonicida]
MDNTTKEIEFSASDESIYSNPFLPELTMKARPLYEQKNYQKEEYERKIHFDQRSTYVQVSGTTVNVSPLSYNIQQKQDKRAKIGERGNIIIHEFNHQADNVMGPGLYQVPRNLQLYIPGSNINVTTFSKQERISPIRVLRSPSPMEYTLPDPDKLGSVHPADIRIKDIGHMRYFDNITHNNGSVGVGTYDIQRQNIKSMEVNRNKRATKDYLKNFGFGNKDDTKYYNIRTTLASPCASFKQADRFKRLNTKRENIFLGPGSHSLIKKW